MSYRFMRIIVFFDLPMDTLEEKRKYRAFRKYLLTNGFLMMQESIYSKLVLNATAARAVQNAIRAKCPDNGLVEMMMVTEKQYNGIEIVVGEQKTEVLNTTEKLVIL